LELPSPLAALDVDPPLSFLCTCPPIGVGSHPGGEFDAPENESALSTSGTELNDSTVESPPLDLRPLVRPARAPAPSSDKRFELTARPRAPPVAVFPYAHHAVHDRSHVSPRARARHRRGKSPGGTPARVDRDASFRGETSLAVDARTRLREREDAGEASHLVRRVVERRHGERAAYCGRHGGVKANGRFSGRFVPLWRAGARTARARDLARTRRRI